MRVLLLLCLLSTSAAAQSFRAGGSFSGGAVPAALTLPNGTMCTAPSLAFTNDSDTGLALISASGVQRMGFCINGTFAGLMTTAPEPDSSTKGTANIALGAHSGESLSSGGAGTDSLKNSFYGANSGNKCTTCDRNTFLGMYAGHDMITGSSNTFIGAGAGSSSLTSNGTTVGHDAGQNFTDLSGSVMVGEEAGFGVAASSTGTHNTLVGFEAGKVITSGSSNVIVGFDAGKDLASGGTNVFIGVNAGLHTTTGSNTIVGGASGNSTSGIGTFTAALGANVLQTATGANNTSLGYGSGNEVTTGHDNVFVGYLSGEAGTACTTCNTDTLIGPSTAMGANNLTNATAIGNAASVAASNTVQIGNTSIVDVVLNAKHLHLAAPSQGSTGTCTTESVAGSDFSGTATATCTIGQTTIVTLGGTYAAAPRCLLTPTGANAAGAQFYVSAADTTTVTFTALVGNAGASTFNFSCVE